MRPLSILSSPAALLCCLCGVLVGAAGYTFREGEGLAYLGNESKTCANCHIMRDQYDGWQKASHHAAATCNDCHVPHNFVGKYLTKAENGFEHSKAFTLQNFHEPIIIRPKSARIVQRNCVRCHGELVCAITGGNDGAGEPFNCVHCHSSVGHGPTR